jgi:DNA-binding transcriptional LysR family regulator
MGFMTFSFHQIRSTEYTSGDWRLIFAAVANPVLREAGMDASDINDMLIFRAVVEAGSFVAGGRSMGLSRSAAGKAIARLEARFGLRLLNRSTRAMQLTEEGRGLLDHVEVIRAAMLAAENAFAPSGPDPRGILRLSAPDAFGRRVILPIVEAFLSTWPDMQVELNLSDRRVNLIDEGFDLAIRIGVTDPAPGLIVRTLLVDETLLVAAPSYLDRAGMPASVEELSTHDLLFNAGQGERQPWHLEEGAEIIRGQGRSRLRLDSGEALRQAALSGMGIALLPAFLVSDDLAARTLQRVLPAVRSAPVPVVALYPHRRYLEQRVRSFIDLLVERLPR